MKDGPWTSVPQGLLDHAKDHLAEGKDIDHRLAMISVDNAVELMLKTYLTLPKRVTGIALSRKERQEYTRSFPAALEAIENFLGDCLTGVPLGEIEWFHDIRNPLYHEGKAVERANVTRYLELAELLMRTLFGVTPPPSDTPTPEVPARTPPPGRPTWSNMIHDTVVRIVTQGGRTTFSPSDVYHEVVKTHPEFNRGTNNAQILAGCVNCRSRINYPGRKPDYYFRLEPGVYRLYDPARDGVWDQEGNQIKPPPGGANHVVSGP